MAVTSTLWPAAVINILLSGLLLLASATCPKQCRCFREKSAQHPSIIQRHVDCSGQLISSLDDVIHNLSNDTNVFDLRVNNIRTIPTDAFAGFRDLTTILLDDNLIDEIEGHAFRELRQIQTLSLTHNKLRTIRSESFSGISGSDEHCGSSVDDSRRCGIYLQENGITLVERHAFAWIKGLEVFIGKGQEALTIEAYAFYGARQIPRLHISRVPELVLQPRIFTNTEDIGAVEIRDTRIEKLDGFVFEGLKNVRGIAFQRVQISVIFPFALSGITFAELARGNGNHGSSRVNKKTVRSDDSSSRAGSSLNFTSCVLDHIHTDAFRDAHLFRINIENSRLGVINESAFRGVIGLKILHLVRNSITTLHKDSFGSLRNLDELFFDGNSKIIAGNSFYETSDISTMRVIISGDTTLEKDAFSGVFNVKHLEISGGSYAAFKPKLIVRAGAFKNLVGVENFRIVNVHLVSLDAHSLAGMTRVKRLEIAGCDVTRINRRAFGEHNAQVGAIEDVYMSVGNNLTCDCHLTTVLREFRVKFASFRVACKHPIVATGTFVTEVDDQLIQDLTKLTCVGNNSAAWSRKFSWIVVLTFVTMSLLSATSFTLNFVSSPGYS